MRMLERCSSARPTVAWVACLLLATSAIAVTGCGGDEDPEEALRDASLELEDANDYVEAAQALVDERQEAVDQAQEALDDASAELADAQAEADEAQSRVSDKATDSALFRAVQRRLLEDSGLEGVAIVADVKGGVVHLRGRVSDPEQRDRAVEIAAETPGVRRVETHIEVPQVEAG